MWINKVILILMIATNTVLSSLSYFIIYSVIFLCCCVRGLGLKLPPNDYIIGHYYIIGT